MATYYADTAKDQPARTDTSAVTVPFQFNTGSTNYGANGNIFVLAKVPKYATVTALFVDIPALDDGTGRVRLGTSDSAARFTSAINTGTAIRVTSFDAAATANTHVLLASLPWRNLNTTNTTGITTDSDIRLTTNTAWNSVVANAVIKGFVTYNCNEPQSSRENP